MLHVYAKISHRKRGSISLVAYHLFRKTVMLHVYAKISHRKRGSTFPNWFPLKRAEFYSTHVGCGRVCRCWLAQANATAAGGLTAHTSIRSDVPSVVQSRWQTGLNQRGQQQPDTYTRLNLLLHKQVGFVVERSHRTHQVGHLRSGGGLKPTMRIHHCQPIRIRHICRWQLHDCHIFLKQLKHDKEVPRSVLELCTRTKPYTQAQSFVNKIDTSQSTNEHDIIIIIKRFKTQNRRISMPNQWKRSLYTL